MEHRQQHLLLAVGECVNKVWGKEGRAERMVLKQEDRPVAGIGRIAQHVRQEFIRAAFKIMQIGFRQRPHVALDGRLAGAPVEANKLQTAVVKLKVLEPRCYLGGDDMLRIITFSSGL